MAVAVAAVEAGVTVPTNHEGVQGSGVWGINPYCPLPRRPASAASAAAAAVAAACGEDPKARASAHTTAPALITASIRRARATTLPTTAWKAVRADVGRPPLADPYCVHRPLFNHHDLHGHRGHRGRAGLEGGWKGAWWGVGEGSMT